MGVGLKGNSLGCSVKQLLSLVGGELFALLEREGVFLEDAARSVPSPVVVVVV